MKRPRARRSSARASAFVNLPSSEQICNVEMTGISISWLLEQADAQEEAVSVVTTDSDGDHM